MTMQNIPDLPQDIWLLITHYLPRFRVMQLLSLNRALFDIVLNERYRKVEWVMFDDHVLKHLVRLQDPYVARRVRHLHLRAWFIQHLFMKGLRTNSRRVLNFVTIRKHISRTIRNLTNHPVPSKRIALLNQSASLASPSDILQAMTNAIRHMYNATEYTFEWRDLPLNSNTRTLLVTAMSAFGNTLCKLQFSARVSQFETILSIAPFKNLEELDLSLEYDPSSEECSASNGAIFTNVIAPFINLHSATLRSLTISSSSQGNLSYLLSALRPFSVLHHLALRVAFDELHLSDPSSITLLLEFHKSSLVSLELQPNRPPMQKDFLSMPFPEWASTWLAFSKQSLIAGRASWLGNLKSLIIPTLDQETTMEMLQQTSPSLSNLCLLDRYLDFADAQQIVVFLGSHAPDIHSLSLEITELSPSIFRLLATCLPSLRSLTLILGFATADTYLDMDWVSAGYRLLEDWALSNLSIFFRNPRPDSVVIIPETPAEQKLMHELRTFVLPKVRTLKGHAYKLV